ncbi:MAG TPA: cupin domain-containing protein [Conexibacter sp.]|jgi:putative monooxygenase
MSSIEQDRPVVEEHALKVRSAEVARESMPSQPEDGRPGWIDMDVRWMATRDNVGAEQGVLGVTYFPPGSRHEIHRHENCEEVEYLVSGEGVARVGDADVMMRAGDAVFVPKNDYHGFRNTSETETAVMVWSYAGAASLEEATYITEASDLEARGA